MKHILTIITILTLSSLSQAKRCTTENVGNSTGQAMTTTWVSNAGGGIAIRINYTYGNVTGTISNNGMIVNIKGVKNGKLIYDDPNDEYGSWEVSCDMNEHNNVMTTGDEQIEFILRSSFAASPQQVQKAKLQEDLGDWAPVQNAAPNTQYSKPDPKPVPQAPKVGAAPVNVKDDDLGDWSPVSQ